VNKNAFPLPNADALMSALVESGMRVAPEALAAIKARLESLLFRRPGWWGAWQASAMSGRELRDALLQHSHLAVEKFTASKVSFDRFSSLEAPFEVALFGERLAGEEPASYDGPIG
jgi:hypothetical protein